VEWERDAGLRDCSHAYSSENPGKLNELHIRVPKKTAEKEYGAEVISEKCTGRNDEGRPTQVMEEDRA
jgi:hypothetical protein